MTNTLHPSNQKIGSTWREKATVAAFYAPAAALICLNAVCAPDAFVRAISWAVGIAGVSLFCRGKNANRTVAEVAPSINDLSLPDDLQEKICELQKASDEMAQKIRKPKTEIQVGLLDSDKNIASCATSEEASFVVFSKETLRDKPPAILRAILAHELAHIHCCHLRRARLYSAFTKAALITTLFTVLDGLTVPLIISLLLPDIGPKSMLERRFEFQADRIGAALDGTAKNLTTFFSSFDLRIKERSSRSKTFWSKVANVLVYRPLDHSFRFFFKPHPHIARRIARLETMDRPQSFFRNLMTDIKTIPASIWPDYFCGEVPEKKSVEPAPSRETTTMAVPGRAVTFGELPPARSGRWSPVRGGRSLPNPSGPTQRVEKKLG
jgi:Zn-dependent protease with chaperone function